MTFILFQGHTTLIGVRMGLLEYSCQRGHLIFFQMKVSKFEIETSILSKCTTLTILLPQLNNTVQEKAKALKSSLIAT